MGTAAVDGEKPMDECTHGRDMGGTEEPTNTNTNTRMGTETDAKTETEAEAGVNAAIPAEVAALETGEVLCDRHRKECFVVRDVEERGTRLERDDEEFYVPHSLLAPWLDSRLFAVEESESADLPAWLSAE